MNIIDGIMAGYIALGIFRGKKHGLAGELDKVVRTGLAFLGSLGLFSVIRTGMTNLLGVEGGLAGAGGFLASFAILFFLLRKIRTGIRVWLAAKFGEGRSLAGALVGGIRATLNSLIVLVAAALSNLEMVIDGSFVGEIINSLLR